MGFLDSLVGNGKETASETPGEKKSSNPFAISLSFTPMRLSAGRKNSVDLVVKVKNVSSQTHLVSVDALLPRNTMLGFDEACINKAIEKRVGEIKPGDSVNVPVRIWANNQTKADSYSVEVTAFSHYIGYNKVLSYMKKSTVLRAV